MSLVPFKGGGKLNTDLTGEFLTTDHAGECRMIKSIGRACGGKLGLSPVAATT